MYVRSCGVEAGQRQGGRRTSQALLGDRGGGDRHHRMVSGASPQSRCLVGPRVRGARARCPACSGEARASRRAYRARIWLLCGDSFSALRAPSRSDMRRPSLSSACIVRSSRCSRRTLHVCCSQTLRSHDTWPQALSRNPSTAPSNRPADSYRAGSASVQATSRGAQWSPSSVSNATASALPPKPKGVAEPALHVSDVRTCDIRAP